MMSTAALAVVGVGLIVLAWVWMSSRNAGPRAGARPRTTPIPPPQAIARVANPKLGDVNADGVVDGLDAQYLADYIQGKGQAPLGPADVNGDGKVDGADLIYLTNHVFAGGPPPVTPGPK